MKLAIHELQASGLTQDMTVGSFDVQLAAIRPHIYKHSTPSGDLRVRVLDLNDKIIATSDAVTISDISDIAFFHGAVKFDIDVQLKASTEYRIQLLGENGYTFSESAYIGWITDYDLRRYELDFSPQSDLHAPLLMEMWEDKHLLRGF